ncbi:MAG TPA: glycosyltransferase family 4 protein [Acidobacteriota bacterium]
MEWFIQNFAEAYPTARLFILFDNETDEVTFRSISACRRVTLHRTKHKTKLPALAEVAEKCGQADVAIFGLGFAFAPNDLLAKVYSHHVVMDNDYTEVVGLSDGAVAEIYSSELLFYLLRLNLPFLSLNDPKIGIKRLLSASGSEIRGKAFDAATTYKIESEHLPENVRVFFPSDVEIVRRVISASPHFAFGGSGDVLSLRLWKETAIQIRDEVREKLIRETSVYRLAVHTTVPRRVLYVSTASVFSGAEEVLCRVIANLDSARFKPYALVAMQGRFSEGLKQAGAEVLCPEDDFGNLSVQSFLFLLRVVKSIQPAIMHFNGLVGAPLLFVGALLGIPVVQHVHVANLRAYGEVLRNADGIITVSKFVKGEVIKFNVRSDKVHVIWNGIDAVIFRRELFERALLRREFGISEDAKVVLMIARFAPNKRQELLLEAAEIVRAHIPSLKIVLVGEVLEAPDYYESIKALVESKELNDTVRFLEFQPDIRKIEATADALVSCSHREPLATSVMEAMAMEVPVIISDSGGTQEIVQDGRTGYVVPAGDANALAKRIVQVLSNSNLTRQVTRAARHYIESELSARVQARRIMDLYEKILESALLRE